jgi:hypothetical protein
VKPTVRRPERKKLKLMTGVKPSARKQRLFQLLHRQKTPLALPLSKIYAFISLISELAIQKMLRGKPSIHLHLQLKVLTPWPFLSRLENMTR